MATIITVNGNRYATHMSRAEVLAILHQKSPMLGEWSTMDLLILPPEGEPVPPLRELEAASVLVRSFESIRD
jgi:hypothetical protein